MRGNLDLITKVVVLFSFVIYATGLLVVNLWLGRHGYHSLSLIRVSYITAGFWVIIIPAILLLLGFVPNTFLEKSARPPKHITGKKIVRLLLMRATIAVIATGGLIYLAAIVFFRKPADYIAAINLWNIFATAGILVASAFVAFAAFHFASRFVLEYSKYVSSPFRYWHDRYYAGFSAFYAIGVAFGYVVFFAMVTYGQIPQAFGGGKPISVRAVLTTEGEIYVRKILPSSEHENLHNHRFELLIQTNEEYVFLVKNVALAVKRDLVQAIAYGEISEE